MMDAWVSLALVLGAGDGLLGYLDPGTGSIILQGILAGIAMLAVTWKMFWRKILVFLRLREPPESLAQDTAGAQKDE